MESLRGHTLPDHERHQKPIERSLEDRADRFEEEFQEIDPGVFSSAESGDASLTELVLTQGRIAHLVGNPDWRKLGPAEFTKRFQVTMGRDSRDGKKAEFRKKPWKRPADRKQQTAIYKREQAIGEDMAVHLAGEAVWYELPGNAERLEHLIAETRARFLDLQHEEWLAGQSQRAA